MASKTKEGGLSLPLLLKSAERLVDLDDGQRSAAYLGELLKAQFNGFGLFFDDDFDLIHV